MLQRRRLCGAVVAAVTLVFAMAAFAHGKRTFPTTLSGYDETPLTINSGGSGEFKATVNKEETAITYVLTYRDLGTVTQAHIHFGRPATSGGIVLYLCSNLAPPAGVPLPQSCPPPPATISGTLTPDDVFVQPGQGIEAGAKGFAAIIEALRNGAAYANVHTTLRPGGEIRGPLGKAQDDDDDHDDD